MNEVIVKSQQEFDELEDFDTFTFVEIKSINVIIIKKSIKNSTIRLYGNSSARLCNNSSAELYDNSSARLYNNSSARLCDNSSARLCDNSSAELYNNSSARLCDNSSAELYDNSSARLYNNSSARLYNNSSAELYDNSSAELYGNSSARLYNNSSAELYDNSSAELYGNSSARLYNNSSAIGYENSTIINYNKENHAITIYDNATIKQIHHNLEIPFDTWLERGLVVADGIYQKLLSTEKEGDITLYRTNKGYVAKILKFFAHGETKNEAIIDLKFKMSKRDVSTYKEWTEDTTVNAADMILAYRVITGACSQGTRQFCRSIQLQDTYKVSDVIQITKGQYGHKEFVDFFKK